MLQMPASTNKNDDAMSLLGTYLLQGWVMTDQLCSETSCSVPLMRSKDGMIQFCVLHDPLPTSSARNTTNNKMDNAITTAPVSDDTEDDESIVLVEQRSVAETVNHDEFKMQQERREQSSRASQLIGQKMLQRWALLNDTCPNATCYAIPLVRHPSNKTTYCVICEQSYQTENSQQQPANSGSSTTHTPMTHTPLDSPALDRSTKRQKVKNKQEDTPTVNENTTATISASSSTLCAAREAMDSSVRQLTNKLTLITDRVDQCTDPKELVSLCQSLEACAKALGACAATLDTLGP